MESTHRRCFRKDLLIYSSQFDKVCDWAKINLEDYYSFSWHPVDPDKLMITAFLYSNSDYTLFELVWG